jgi:ATP-binding cassette subfamily B protein
VNHIWRILKFTRQLWPYYLVVSFISILVALAGLAIPFFSGKAIDAIQAGGSVEISYVVWLAAAIFGLDLATTVLTNVGGYYGDQMSEKLQKLLSTRYYQHILGLQQKYFDTELSGKIINRLNRSIDQIASFMHMLSNNFLQFIFSTVFALVIIAIYSWPIALLLFALYPIYIWMTVKTSGKWMEYQHTKNDYRDLATGRFAESINQIKVVKSFIQERRELKFFDKQYAGVVKTNIPQSSLWHKRDVQRRLVLNVIFFAVYVLIFIQGVNGTFSAGQAVALILYAMQIRIPIFTISFLVENTQKAVADSRDYFEIMNLEPEITDRESAKSLRVTKGQVVFDDVAFAYDKEAVIKGVTFDIKPDTKVALVGESGEGKTTITNLLMRLYEPQSGKILIDEQDINDVTQESLRSQIGVVFQEPALFSGTIRENISYSNDKASDAQIQSAAKAANAHEFIKKFEKGYDTQIGERGLKLSGGQKQRIAIARALLKDAPILILDEATSSLDSKSEAMVQEALERLMKGRTTLIIAHRLSTISHVDQIITIAGGKVEEIGSPTELAKTDGIYAQLLKLQQGKTEVNKKKLASYELKA